LPSNSVITSPFFRNSFERQAVKLPGKVKNGVVVDQVDNNGLADRSGLKKGDVITFQNYLDWQYSSF
jgi:S1-C subfamily serine protease